MDGNPEAAWWRLVPRPFLALILFCFGFAALSLLVIAVLATSASSASTESETALLCIGILSSVVGSLQTASGYCAQRLGHQLDCIQSEKRMASAPGKGLAPQVHHRQAKHRTSALVMIGVLLLACGTISAVVNLGILRQSVTAPFAATTLVFNGVLACMVLHEPITRFDVLATILVLLGVCVAMVGVGMAEQQSTASVLADIERLFLHSPFPAVCTGATASALLATTWLIQHHYLQTSALGFCCFAVGAGVLSGFSSLCVKATVEITKGAVGSPPSDDLQNPVTYIFVLGIVVCVLAQLKLMSLGLQHFGTLKFVPAYHAFIVLSNLMNGLVFFDEARDYDQHALAVFGVGCGLAIAGVLLLVAKAPHPQDELLMDVFELDDGFERACNPDFVEDREKDDTLKTRGWKRARA